MVARANTIDEKLTVHRSATLRARESSVEQLCNVILLAKKRRQVARSRLCPACKQRRVAHQGEGEEAARQEVEDGRLREDLRGNIRWASDRISRTFY